MRRLVLAFRVFFRVLFDAQTAQRIEKNLDAAAEQPPEKPPERVAAPKQSGRSEALTLLATLQREARLIDFLKEPIDSYSDAQVGAAVREVHRECGKVLQRLLAVRPLLTEEEGAEVEVPAGFDAFRYRLSGNVSGDPPHKGRVAHQGWQATMCQLPEWSGPKESALVLAPAEVDVK